MTDSVRGGIIVSVTIFALVVYYFLWVYEAPAPPLTDGDNGSSPPTANYLDHEPEIPVNEPMRIGEPAPDFAYMTIDGRQIRLSDFIGSKRVLLDFWGTNCNPCLLELPVLNAFYAEHSDEIEIIAVTEESRRAAPEVARVVRDKELAFNIIHDPTRRIKSLYPSRGIPYLVYVDLSGIAIRDNLGYNPESDLGAEILEVFGLAP